MATIKSATGSILNAVRRKKKSAALAPKFGATIPRPTKKGVSPGFAGYRPFGK